MVAQAVTALSHLFTVLTIIMPWGLLVLCSNYPNCPKRYISVAYLCIVRSGSLLLDADQVRRSGACSLYPSQVNQGGAVITEFLTECRTKTWRHNVTSEALVAPRGLFWVRMLRARAFTRSAAALFACSSGVSTPVRIYELINLLHRYRPM